jgi:hypothetical protein
MGRLIIGGVLGGDAAQLPCDVPNIVCRRLREWPQWYIACATSRHLGSQLPRVMTVFPPSLGSPWCLSCARHSSRMST